MLAHCEVHGRRRTRPLVARVAPMLGYMHVLAVRAADSESQCGKDPSDPLLEAPGPMAPWSYSHTLTPTRAVCYTLFATQLQTTNCTKGIAEL